MPGRRSITSPPLHRSPPHVPNTALRLLSRLPPTEHPPPLQHLQHSLSTITRPSRRSSYDPSPIYQLWSGGRQTDRCPGRPSLWRHLLSVRQEEPLPLPLREEAPAPGTRRPPTRPGRTLKFHAFGLFSLSIYLTHEEDYFLVLFLSL